MGRIQGLAETGILTSPVAVKSAEGYVFSITLSWTGATAGDKVYLLDATSDSGDPADQEVVFVLNDTTGTITREWSQGKHFDTGIFYKEGTNADCFTEMTIK